MPSVPRAGFCCKCKGPFQLKTAGVIIEVQCKDGNGGRFPYYKVSADVHACPCGTHVYSGFGGPILPRDDAWKIPAKEVVYGD